MKKIVILKVAVGAIGLGLAIAGCYAGKVEAENLLLTPFWQKTASVQAGAETEEPCVDCAWTTTTTNNK